MIKQKKTSRRNRMIIQYKKKRGWLGTVFLVEILKGMGLTLRRMLSRSVTRQYPEERPEIRIGFRGQHALARDPVTGGSRCVACMRCAVVCPSRCIHIEYKKDEQTGVREVQSYAIEALRCIYCGYCEEVCPVNAVILTEVYEYAAYKRDAFYFDEEQLLKNWDRFIEESRYDPTKYVNPFWRPRGIDERTLAGPRRRSVPDDWKMENQWVGTGMTKSRKTGARCDVGGH